MLIDTKHKFIRLYHHCPPGISYIECFMSCLTLNFKVKGQCHRHETYFSEFPYINVVVVDTKHKFIWHIILSEISYWMRYVMFDLEFQGPKRSQYYHIFFGFPDINLVGIDTKITFLSHRHQEILNNVIGVQKWPFPVLLGSTVL